MIKSLLTSCVVLAAALTSSWADAQVTVSYPAPGSTLDNVQLLGNFNLAATGSYTVAENAKATLECLDTGDIFDCTTFTDFMGMAIVVKFDSAEITDNGDYEFTILPGAITVDGVPNEKITASYTLSDPSLGGAGQFPQISLVSSDPASGSGVAAIGTNSLNRVSFVTSDDAAVNYIGWELWNVTDAENPQWVYQGSENRIDPNRNGGSLDDVWANGLYISIGGSDQKLIKGQKYEMKLVFCGIGYNPDTNQYPNSVTIENSKELETSIFFEGLTPGTEYSPYVYQSISPDPATYEIETVQQAMFTITYSGPVKPAAFTYHQGIADTPVAGTFTPADDDDADGYASVWDFIVDPEIARNLTGDASFVVTTADKDGLMLKGNGGYPIDDFEYHVVYQSSVGLPDLVSVAPEAQAVVESLSEIIVGNSSNLSMAYSFNASESARIVDMFGTEIINLGEPVAVDGHADQMKWTFDPITVSGNYALIIPKWYFAIGEEFEGTTNKFTSFRYTVENSSAGSAVFDIVPASVSPEDGATVSELSKVVVTFDEITYYPMVDGAPVATIYKDDATEPFAVTEPAVDNDFLFPTEYTFTLTEPIKEKGTYRFVIARGAFCDETYDMEMGESGHANDEIVYTFIVDDGGGVAGIGADASAADVFSVDGKLVLRNASDSDVKALPAGIYIFGGKKLVVK